ncbi:hypothetical protein EPO15_16620 [bacterium]|nr:MAG: hypothetical protein EPO15_16620 [bacterium]
MPLLALLALLAAPAHALGKPEYELELDPYYSAAAMTVAFSSGAAEGKADEEFSTYRDLTRQALLPKFAILEASVNPLPLLGVGYRAVSEDAYRRAKVTPSLNYIDAVTTGFEEPYALALFLGNVTDFSKGLKTSGHKRKGYVGYLASLGNFHIMESLVLPDNWAELEAKIKGDLVTEKRKMSFSFRVGGKLHSNREVTDTLYFGIKRDRIDYVKTPLSALLSSGLMYRADFRSGDWRPMSHFVLLEKNFPFAYKARKLTFSLGLGYQWLSKEKYTGSLAARRLRPEARFLLRPNVKF